MKKSRRLSSEKIHRVFCSYLVQPREMKVAVMAIKAVALKCYNFAEVLLCEEL